MSFGFWPIKEAFDNEEKLRELLELRLDEISLTAIPAYDMTKVEARCLRDSLENRKDEQPMFLSMLNQVIRHSSVKASEK